MCVLFLGCSIRHQCFFFFIFFLVFFFYIFFKNFFLVFNTKVLRSSFFSLQATAFPIVYCVYTFFVQVVNRLILFLFFLFFLGLKLFNLLIANHSYINIKEIVFRFSFKINEWCPLPKSIKGGEFLFFIFFYPFFFFLLRPNPVLESWQYYFKAPV